MNRDNLLLIANVFLVFVTELLSAPLPKLNIEQATDASDIVCVCKIIESELKPPIATKSGIWTAQAEVSAVFKGEDKNHVILQIPLDSSFIENPDFGRLRTGDIAILFLKATTVTGQVFTFSVSGQPGVPLAEFDDLLDISTNSVRERIAAQLRKQVDSGITSNVIDALFWLSELGLNVSDEKLWKFTESTDYELSLMALDLLIRRRDIGAITKAARIILDDKATIRARAVQRILSAMRSVASVVPINIAMEMATDERDNIRRIGAEILQTIGDESSVAILVRLLDDEDSDVQYSAVMALARISGNTEVSFKDFLNDRETVIRKYKESWYKKVNHL